MLVIALVIVAVFVFIGLFYALSAIVTWIKLVVVRYMQTRELRILAEEYIVQDLSRNRPPPAALAVPAPSAPPAANSAQVPMLNAAPTQDIMTAEGSVPMADVASEMTSRDVVQEMRRDLQAVYGIRSDMQYTGSFLRPQRSVRNMRMSRGPLESPV